MRLLRDVHFDLDDAGRELLVARMEAFLRCGSFTFTEWESLTQEERDVAVRVKKALRLEDALFQRETMLAGSVADAAKLLEASGDQKSAAKMLLTEAIQSVKMPVVTP